ncbi:NnrU family protein [Desulfuromonas sp.]|uniref:methyltransferase family protein n=1 Tax=Desulfuromonas sp. TaxID=892 RepID=UPI0025C7102E|nr:NnrU family protein [Desulfuromonas sp.]
MNGTLALLALLWCIWCALHSLLASPRVKARLGRLLGRREGLYRLCYNLFALATLIPLGLWSLSLQGRNLLSWSWPFTIVQAILWGAAAVLFWGGARAYPVREFLGLGNQRSLGAGARASENRLEKAGVLRMVRHPWYLAGLILLWARDLDPAALVTSVVFSLYLVIGAHLEEKRLVDEFGEEYRIYQREVPMFIPFRGGLRFRRGGRRDS